MKEQTFRNMVPVIGILCGILIPGCSSTPDPAPSDDPQAVLSGTDEQIFVGDSIEMNYDPQRDHETG